jgi:hypothetical protein
MKKLCSSSLCSFHFLLPLNSFSCAKEEKKTRKEHRANTVNRSALWHELCEERRCDARQFRLHYHQVSRRFYSRHRNRPNYYLVLWGAGESEKVRERKASSWRDSVMEGTSTHLCVGPGDLTIPSFVRSVAALFIRTWRGTGHLQIDWPTDQMTDWRTD